MAGILEKVKGALDSTLSLDSKRAGKTKYSKKSKLVEQDIDIFDLLIKIDEGYSVTEDEKKMLGEVDRVSWYYITKLPNSMEMLGSLRELSITSDEVKDISVLSNLTSLSTLILKNATVVDISALSNLTSLSYLDLSFTQVSDISPLSNLTFLSHLDLSFTQVSDLSPLSGLMNLRTLDLGGIEINDLDALSGLISLSLLNLQNSKTAIIPKSILDLGLNFITREERPFSELSEAGIYIHGLTLTDQPTEIFSQSKELIRAYYREEKLISVNECKVIFLGDPESGKTHSIKRLLNNGEFLRGFDGESTLGIEMAVSRIKFEDSEITVNYWDFGGQEILHSMHRVFLTERTVYVVFLNARQDDQMDERARYWMENIKAFAPQAPVLVVINKIDLNKHPRFNEKGFLEAYGDRVKKVIRLSAKKDTRQVFFDKLQCNINSIIMELPTVSNMIPYSWKSLIEDIREMENHYLTTNQFIEKCILNGIKDYRDIHGELVDLLQVLGVGFCYYKDRSSADYMLLNPKWLLNALYTIVINGKAVARNGVITQNDLFDLFQEDTIDGVLIRRAIPELRYRGFEVNYILGVIRMFNLSYRLADGSEFFPMLCDREEKISAKEAVPENSLHFIFRYTYLLTNIMHRVIVNMRRDLDYQYVWYTGAVFRNKLQNQSAYIHTIGNDLHIYVYGEEEYFNLNEYLTLILNNVRYINKDLGLSAVELLTYRINGVEAIIPLNEVLGNLRNGVTEVYNATLDEIISYNVLARRYIYHNSSILDSFFRKHNEKCPRFIDLQEFIAEENSDELQEYLHKELKDIFKLAETQDTNRREREVQEILELLWKLYLVDSNRIKKVVISTTQGVELAVDANDESNEETAPSTSDTAPQDKQDNSADNKEDEQYKPEPSDLEEATRLALLDFEEWLKEKADKEGLTFAVEKHPVRQYSGLQYGYDVGMNIKYGDTEYRLRFECKDYTSNISKRKQDRPPELSVSRYAYNLLEYYMESKSEINNRWVLVCPFGGLQNDFPERLFDQWNKDHTFIKIYAIMENGPSLTCKDFLSVNEKAYELVYKDNYDGNKTRNDVFNYLFNRIVGEDDVREEILKRLETYSFWRDYGGYRTLLPVPDKNSHIALGQIFEFLQRKKNSIGDEQKRILFVIGEYGTGKSWLCFQAIEQIVSHPSDYPFMPFYIALKDLSQNKGLDDKTLYKSIMKDTLRTFYDEHDEWAKKCVQKHYIPIYFLDGFDEVFSGLSATDKKIEFLLSIIDELKDWYEKHENKRYAQKHIEPLFVITSRESDFEVGMKSEDFQQQMEQAEVIELEMCSVEEVQKEWSQLEQIEHIDGSWLLQLEQNSAFLSILRRPVFFNLCSYAAKRGVFKRKVASSSLNEADVLDMLFEDELGKYAENEGIDKNEIRREIYRCAVKCSIEKKSQVVYEGKGINEVIHVGMVKIKKDQENEGTCWVSFEHNIVREYLTARYLTQCLIDCSPEERKNPLKADFVLTLKDLSLTPEALKLLLLCIEKESPKDKGERYKQQLKEWLCNEGIKKSNSRVPGRLLEILLQPGHILCGDNEGRLDLSGLHASDLCLWNCGIRHVNLSQGVLRNWQMINLKLEDVDLRGADMDGLKLAPDKPISSFCYWKDTKEWHVAALHENGQIMQYSFQKNSWAHYSAKVLSKTEVKDGLFRFGNELLLYTTNKLYDEKENELYQVRSNNELHQIVTASGLCGFITKQEDTCQAVLFQGEMVPTAFVFNVAELNRICITEKGQLLYTQNATLNLIDQNGAIKKICDLENEYESFAVCLRPVEKACVFIKHGESLIRIALDKELHELVSNRKKMQITGEIETIRELRVLDENSFAAVGKNELFILSLEKNKEVERVKSLRLKTAISIKNCLLEDEGGKNRVQDGKAYELLRTSMS